LNYYVVEEESETTDTTTTTTGRIDRQHFIIVINRTRGSLHIHN